MNDLTAILFVIGFPTVGIVFLGIMGTIFVARLQRESHKRQQAHQLRRQQADREKAERERVERERLKGEQAEKEKKERERTEREGAERERAERKERYVSVDATLELCYTLLGVSTTASLEEIERAYRLKAKKFHPDHKGDEDIMKTLNEAVAKLRAHKR